MKNSYLSLLVAATISMTPLTLALAESPYSGQEQRAIKALSADQIEKLLQGSGMGFALSAELNQYPGPKHVLELQQQLSLSEQQLHTTQRLFDVMNAEARILGADLIVKEEALESLFRSGKITSTQIEKSVSAISLLRSQLRNLHLITHINQRDLLSNNQQLLYQQLHGYDQAENTHNHKKHVH